MERDPDEDSVTPSPGLGTGKSKLDTLSKEDLIKFAKKQMVVMQKLKSKCTDLEKEIGEQKSRPSSSSDDSVIQALTERMDAVLLEKAETHQALVLLRKEHEKATKQAEESLKSLTALQEKLDQVHEEHTENIRVMKENFEASEANYKEELESFKKREIQQNKHEEIQQGRLTEEFNSKIEAIRQEYENKISDLQQNLESTKKEWAAETQALVETHQIALKKSEEDFESLHEEIAKLTKQHEAQVRDLEEQLETNAARLTKQHEAEVRDLEERIETNTATLTKQCEIQVRDLEEQLEMNAADFEMERERLLLLQDNLAEQLALKESCLQDVQEEEEDSHKNTAPKASEGFEAVDSSTTVEQPDNESDRLRLTLEELQSQNTMLQEELTFLRNVKTGLENELQHIREEFMMEKEELEFKINELQMTKEDGDTCVEKEVQTVNDQHDEALQAFKELHQTEMKELEARLIFNAEREKEASAQELKDLCYKCDLLSEEKKTIISEYEHTKDILRNLQVDLEERTNDFVKQYNAMKEQAAASIQELQEQINEKDRLIQKLESLKQPPCISEPNSHAIWNTTSAETKEEVQELEGNQVVATLDKESQTTLTTDTEHGEDEDKLDQGDTTQFSLQKMEDLTVALDEAVAQSQNLKSCIADLEDQLSSSTAEKDHLAKRCSTLADDLAALKAVEEQYQATINQFKTKTNEEKAELEKELHSALEEKDSLRKDIESGKRKLLNAQAHISEILEQNYSMTAVEEEEDLSVLLNHLMSRVQEEKTNLKQLLEEQAAQLMNMHSQENSPDTLQVVHAESQTQNAKDSQAVEVMEGLIVKGHENDDAQETDDMKRFQQKLSEKESVIAQLKEEISSLQESKLSTLSENMRQIETLEKECKEKDERMNKIKAVAVKAKKELENSRKETSELKEQLEAVKGDRDKLSDSMKGIIHGAEDYKNIMIEYDKQTELLDKEKEKLEAAEKQNADLNKRLQAAIDQHKQQLSEREDLMAHMETLQSNVRQLEAQTLELDKLKSGLERDLETERLLKEQKTKDHQSAAKEVEELNALLHKQKQQLQQTEQELEQLRKDAQQNTLLDMEMADYERLVKELNNQLSEKEKLIEEKESLAQAQKEKEEKLIQEIESLKSSVDTAEDKASKMKQLLVKTKKDLADAKKEEASQMIIHASLKGELEATQQQLESYKIQCSEMTADRHRLQEQLKSVNDQNQKAFSSYQHQLTTIQEELSSKKTELESTVSDFESYKVRVHNVLKQQKNKSSTQSDGEFSKQEREHLEVLLEQLRSKLQESQLNLQSSSAELQQLHTEHDMLLERHNRMLQQTVTKEAELRERVLSLHSENVALRSEHSQSVSQLTAQAEALRSSFREQVHHLQEENRSTVETLQQQINRLEAQLFQLQKEPVNTGPVQQTRKSQLDRKLTDLPLIDLQSMAREEGEGMETTETELISTAGTPPPTLEQLLTSPEPKQEPFVWQVAPTMEELTQKLNTANRSMEHINSLLHESEATNAILLEQNNLLKSELRRLERNQEREKSVANLEYLKNVLLQFIFLRSGSEKQALLPVIHTMLQLSPEEKSKLAAIAQGEEEAAGSRGAGWTSYLHSWSGIR